MEVQMDTVRQYDPLRWPPDLQLAKVHMSCVCPGKDNIEGIECPCCGRFQKIKTKNWYSRDIFKDFKNYGGGIPCYFSLLKYCVVSLVILSVIVILYHIYILQITCPDIFNTLQSCPHIKTPPTKKQQVQCQSFLFVFKICDSKYILETLKCQGKTTRAYIFFSLQLFSFLYLIAATLGMKLWLRKVNTEKIERQQKVYSLFSLMLKNIPKYYKLQQLRKQIQDMLPEAQICELFFLYEIAELETNYKKLFDLHFVIEHIRESIAADRGETVQHLEQLINQYRTLYEKCEQLKKNMNINNGRAIVVFNNMQDRDKLYQKLKINECNKLIFHTFKLVGINTRKLHFFADRIHQPQQIIWKYVGESSVTKTWVRIKTTCIGFGFMIASFLLLYFPIIEIDEKNIQNHSTLTSALSVLISIILQVLAIVYRQIILKILPDRHPSTRQSQSYFIVITTVVFHFFFYVIAPGTYFEIATSIYINIKIKQLFVTVLVFLLMTLFVAIIDLRYLIFNSRRKKTISKWSEWGRFCQIRLHEQLRWPSFPIEFKLMVLLNIWSFNAFYVFEMPYLMFLFAVIITILFWIDKKNIYTHYKMQVYQSIQLELSVQRDYTIMFLVCVCCGYAVSAVQPWQYIFIGATFLVSLVINFFIAYKTRQKKSNDYEKTLTLCQFVKAQSANPKKSMINDIITTQFKQNVLLLDNVSTVSLGSATLQYGYKQMYDNYLNQFKNRQILKLLLDTYNYYDHPEYNPENEINQIRRITNMSNLENDNNPNDYYTNLYKVTGKNRQTNISQSANQSMKNKLIEQKQEKHKNSQLSDYKIKNKGTN